MLTPKEKAKELVDKFKPYCNIQVAFPKALTAAAKQCALITVDEILPCTWKLATYKAWKFIDVSPETTTEYWKQVKEEIKNQ